MSQLNETYYIAPGAVRITPNAISVDGDAHRYVAISVTTGTLIMLSVSHYSESLGINYTSGLNNPTWRLVGYSTQLNAEYNDKVVYIYARLEVGAANGILILSPNDYTTSETGSEQTAVKRGDYIFVKLGYLTAPVEGLRSLQFDSGCLLTQYGNDLKENNLEGFFSLVGNAIQPLKNFVELTINNTLTVIGTLKTNILFLAGKKVKGIDDSTTSDAPSDDHLATSDYVDANALSSKADDTANGKITFAQGINMDSVDITNIDTSDESFNTTKDNSLPTSKAVVRYVDDSTLSSKTEDTAKGKITFMKGLEVGEYQQLMKGGSIDEDGNAELNSLKLRESLIVPEIKYNRATVYKGIQYLTFGGGVIESVTPRVDRSGTLTLKLEDGEPLSVKKGDLCVGFWHFLDATNDDESKDEKNGNFKIAGFSAIYFEVLKVSDDGVIDYVLRDEYNVHPQPNLNFACYSNKIQYGQPGYDKDRHACKITTTDYEIRLQNLDNWEYTSDNIYRIEGKLKGFSMTAVNDGRTYKQEFNGHGVVFGNAYMYGTLQQFDREVWSMVLWYENDNLLSDTGKLLSCKVYRNGIEVDYSNNGTGGTFGNISYTRESEDKGSDEDWNDKHSNKTDISILLKSSDLPDGYDTATFKVTAVCYSMGVDGKGSNVTSVSESVTFHRLKQGTEGNGIVKVEEFYLVSEKPEKITITGNTWYPTPPLTTKEKPYLWNYEKITYTKSGPTTTDPAVIGKHGDDGRGIESIKEWYGVSSNDKTVPTTWYETPQTTDPTNKYLWNKETITYTDDTSETTTPAIIGTYGDKGNDGNDGKDAVQPNYMDGTSVDGTVERNEWKVNTYNINTNPYRIGDGIFDGKNIMTLQPSMFGRKVRISYKAQGYVDNYSLKNNENYIVLSATFKVPWVKGIAQTTADYKKLHAYIGNIKIDGKSLNSPVMEIDKVYSNITEITQQYKIDNGNWVKGPTLIPNGATLYAQIRIRITDDSSYYYSNIVEVYTNNTDSDVSVSTTPDSVYSTVSFNSESNKSIVAGETPVISSWVGHHYFNDDEKNNNIYYKFNFGWTPPSNMTELAMKFRIGAMYSNTERYITFSEVKAELWDEKRSENTAYIPSENDKARATNVNLLDGTRNGKNSEGKEIWDKTTNNRGTITFGDNLFTLTSSQVHYEGNCMSITPPKITLLQSNYTLSFDMKMVNCYGARLVVNGISHTTIASTTDWTTHRILLPKYSGEKTFRFDSMLSIAAGTTSHLYIRNIKLEEGCFGTAWTISENDKGGKPGFSYRPCGTYDPTVLYVANNEVRDAVYYKDDKDNTGWYICRVSNKGQTPSPNSTYWEKSSYIKFLSVEALFADNLFTNAIQSGSGYFDGLNAKTVKISGELNATSGTFDNVVINGAYNKLVQELTTGNISTFLTDKIAVKADTGLGEDWTDTFNGNGTYMKSWGDIVVIKSFPTNNAFPYIVLPALLPGEDSNGNFVYRPIIGKVKEKTETGGDSERDMTVDDVRSLIGRKIIIRNTTTQRVYVTSVFMYKFPEFGKYTESYIIDNTNDSQYWYTGYGGADNDVPYRSWSIGNHESLLLECVSVRVWVDPNYWEGVAWTGKILRYPLKVQSNRIE